MTGRLTALATFAAAAAASMLGAFAATATAQQHPEPPASAVPGMSRMHELMIQQNPGMARMHELMLEQQAERR